MGKYVKREYHSYSDYGRAWWDTTENKRQRNQSWRSDFDKEGPYIGVEFECISSAGNYSVLLDALPNFPFGREPLAEDDGSLPGRSGLELIFPPVSYKQLKKSSSVFGKCIAALDGKITTDRNITGMHMNVNTNHWSADKKLLFIATFHNIMQEALECIGGRQLNTYCKQLPDEGLYYYEDVCDHSYCAEYLDNRVELRFPKSTTDHSKVTQLIEFIEVVETFAEVEVANCHQYEDSTHALEASFRKFCSKSKKGKRVLGYLYDKSTTSPDSNSSAAPAQQLSLCAA